MTLQELITAALKEDMPHGDLTTESLAVPPRMGDARLVAKQDLVVSGISPFEQTVLTLDPTARLQWHFKEGDPVLNKQVICHISCDLVQLLKAERVALNFIGHLSGIATLTYLFVDKTKHTKTRIIDTRKTIPVFRELAKKAVVHGGGLNHRMNLSDEVLIKDNHIRLVGSLSEAVRRIRLHSSEKIEVETSTLEEVKEAVASNVERILLDNMSLDDMREALKMIPTSTHIEASGNMSLDRVKSVAELGVHFISVGALTHSAPTADMSLMFDWQEEAP